MGCLSSKKAQPLAKRKPAQPLASESAGPKSSFNKTKGGSMLLNAAEKKMLGEEETATEFTDTQHICSPPTVDWKVSKQVKKIPEMSNHELLPVLIPSEQGGGVVHALVGYKTLQGKNPKPPHKPNQDCVSIFIVDGHPNLVVFACFDGHGPFGEHASHFCRSRLHPAMLDQGHALLSSDPRAAFTNAIAKVHSAFCSEETLKCGVDPVVSGTTCIALLFDGKQVHTANVGDSRAIIGTIRNHELVVEALSDDHKPQRADERARLEASEALLLTEREVRGFGDDSKIYICRERGGDIVYGVLFTRSLGDADAHAHLGVSALPEMGLRTLGEHDRYFILASDGVWDFMSNEEVMELAQIHSDPIKISEAIVKEASERWELRDTDHRRDDITVVVVKTEIYPPKEIAPEAPEAPPAAAAAAAAE